MVKRYPVKYIKTYAYGYIDESGKEQTEDIVFMANGYLFPLFKSITGIELTQALDDYKKGLTQIITPENMAVLYKLQEAGDTDAKLDIAVNNSELLIDLLRAAGDTELMGGVGLSLTELIIICTRICALPQTEHAEALGAGTELLPQEIYEDPAFAFEILSLATAYDDHAKKNLKASRNLAGAIKQQKP